MAVERSDDVDRVFRTLVYELADRRPTQLHSSFQVSELYQEILPYRRFRSTLQFDTHEDYEIAVLRLLAGAKGYVLLEPPEAREALAVEAEALNPVPGAFRDFAAARITLSEPAVQLMLGRRDSYAPSAPTTEPSEEPEEEPSAEPEEQLAPVPVPDRVPPPAVSIPYTLDPAADAECPACARTLPQGRVVVYCPFCGAHVAEPRCPACSAQLDAGWTFCITCGHTVRRG